MKFSFVKSCFASAVLAISLFINQQTVQAQNIQWQHALGGSRNDYAGAIKQTSDGGYITVGFSYSTNGDVTSNHGDADILVMKLNSDSTLQWQQTFGGSGFDRAYAVQQTTDGGYIIAGYTKSNDFDVTGNNGFFDIWVMKLNATGALQWQKALGGTDFEQAYAIQQTADGGYIVAGRTQSNDGDVSGNHGNADGWVVKLSNAGAVEWQKALGGTNFDELTSIQQTSDGGYIAAGYTASTDGDVSGSHGGGDYWVVKLSNTGTIVWQKALGGTQYDYANAVKPTSDGGYIVAGYAASNDGDVTGGHGANDYWIVKLSSTGSIDWQKALGGASEDYAYDVQPSTDGGYIIAGYTASNDGDVTVYSGNKDFWVVKLTTAGAIQWQKTFGGTSYDYAYSVQQTSDGGYIVGGYTASADGNVYGYHGLGDAWVVKLSSDAVAPQISQSLKAAGSAKGLLVAWSAPALQKNPHFNVELSADNKTFKKVSSVDSQSGSGGNYSVTIPPSQVALGMLSFLFVIPVVIRRRKHKIISMLALVIAAVSIVACSKKADITATAPNQYAGMFVRIAQVDNDGSIHYSKSVNVSDQ